MVVKPAAQMAEMVADALAVRAAGGEQHAGGFDRAGGIHYDPRSKAKNRAMERPDLVALPVAAIDVEIDGSNTGVQKYGGGRILMAAASKAAGQIVAAEISRWGRGSCCCN